MVADIVTALFVVFCLTFIFWGVFSAIKGEK